MLSLYSLQPIQINGLQKIEVTGQVFKIKNTHPVISIDYFWPLVILRVSKSVVLMIFLKFVFFSPL
jgi:hypothetical protein